LLTAESNRRLSEEITVMKTYHRTSMALADLILIEGFRDDVGPSRVSLPPGVFLADWPIGAEELKRKGDRLDTLLVLTIPDSIFAKYEWADSPYDGRVSIVPAANVNEHGRPAIAEHQLDDATEEDLLASARISEKSGNGQQAEWIRGSLAFLRKHGRLGGEG
jgi:hypothetical protein